ncbi:hypothetical protein Afil01_68780 [Actinorhabdospora filicis]|uniref:Uncharacterized protein n=1 Tax=Actinorhabdospora filicis TaxID=1785913 RepID=A0A9W6WDY6_9ACTN|nr:hypothetical protein [Actinorhabdospora filicis]GLZ82071.1 hypothetical protein Afil01_68780 [Actinorhabdospora filicis]
MKEELGGYETRLLAELTQVVENRAQTRRNWARVPKPARFGMALAGIAVVAALAVPMLGFSGEGSPDAAPAVAVSVPVSGNQRPVGYSLAVDGESVTVTVGDIQDGAGLEAALKKEGIGANVTVLDGVYRDCRWPAYTSPSSGGSFSAQRTPDGGATFTLDRAEFAHGETLLMAVYHVRSDEGAEIEEPLVGLAYASADPGDCVAVE